MKQILFLLFPVLACVARAAQPTVSLTDFSENADGSVAVAYTLSDGPAIVTADIQTNAGENAWVSVGGLKTLNGDVHRLVEKTAGTASWNPRIDLPGRRFDPGEMRVVLTAWPTNDPPDYMIVSLEPHADCRVEYFERAELIPCGLLADTSYRVSSLAFRRIRAKGVRWTMGSVGETGRTTQEKAHEVVLDHDYWMGVFEVTFSQVSIICGYELTGGLKPYKNMAYSDIRGTSALYPDDPSSGSLLGMLKTRTGIAFDLPSEAEWEFAARAGHGEGHAGTAEVYTSTIAPTYAWYGQAWSSTHCGIEAGGRLPNDFGLYDMFGNEREFCLDWYQADISAFHDGRVNAKGSTLDDGVTAGTTRVLKGGDFTSSWSGCRPACRVGVTPTTCGHENGFRLASRYGLY